jgi:curved DNA-binding protein CbpA
MSEAQRNYYDILGIRNDANNEQIREIYKKLSLIYHPDIGKHLGVDGEKKFREIKEAYETLMDPKKRSEYDKSLSQPHIKNKITKINKSNIKNKFWSEQEDNFLINKFMNYIDEELAISNIFNNKSKNDIKRRREDLGLIRPKMVKRVRNQIRTQRIAFKLQQNQIISGKIQVSGGNNDIIFGVFDFPKNMSSKLYPYNKERVTGMKIFSYSISSTGNVCFYFSNEFSIITSKYVSFQYKIDNGKDIGLSFSV